MRSDQNQNWLPIALIAGAMVVWGGVLGLGAYWAPSGVEAGADFRKFLVLAATTAGFLLFWALALYLRARRVRRQQRAKNAQQDQTSSS
ncbi:MAG: hypothetical protein KDA57_02780 [Planctomycetales bacterium]|nr:hypothetical protein [Planctomycetales bacterium]